MCPMSQTKVSSTSQICFVVQSLIIILLIWKTFLSGHFKLFVTYSQLAVGSEGNYNRTAFWNTGRLSITVLYKGELNSALWNNCLSLKAKATRKRCFNILLSTFPLTSWIEIFPSPKTSTWTSMREKWLESGDWWDLSLGNLLPIPSEIPAPQKSLCYQRMAF